MPTRLLSAMAATMPLLVACQSIEATALSPLDLELIEIASLLEGDFVSTTEDGAREDRSIYMRVRSITPPEGHAHAMYSEMRHDGPEGDFYRQVIYLFDEAPDRTVNRMTALRVTDADAAAQLLTEPNAFATGAVEATNALSENCYAVWVPNAEGFASWIDPERCVITGRRGDQRRIEARTHITANSIGQLERGFTLDGDLLFGNPDGDLYVWPRVSPTTSD